MDPCASRPRLVEGTSAWVLFPPAGDKEAIYVVGSRERDRYLTVPESTLAAMNKVLACFDGTRSVSQIQQQACDLLRVRVDVPGLCEKLDEAGLLASAGDRPGDVTRMSASLVDARLPEWALPTTHIPPAVTRAAAWLAAALCAWAMTLVLARGIPGLASGANKHGRLSEEARKAVRHSGLG